MEAYSPLSMPLLYSGNAKRIREGEFSDAIIEDDARGILAVIRKRYQAFYDDLTFLCRFFTIPNDLSAFPYIYQKICIKIC